MKLTEHSALWRTIVQAISDRIAEAGHDDVKHFTKILALPLLSVLAGTVMAILLWDSVLPIAFNNKSVPKSSIAPIHRWALESRMKAQLAFDSVSSSANHVASHLTVRPADPNQPPTAAELFNCYAAPSDPATSGKVKRVPTTSPRGAALS